MKRIQMEILKSVRKVLMETLEEKKTLKARRFRTVMLRHRKQLFLVH